MTQKKGDTDGITRRRFVKTGVSTAAAGSLLSTSRTNFGLTQSAEAVAPVVAAGAVGAGAVAAGYAGYKIREWQAGQSEAQEDDAKSQLQDELYFHAVDIAATVESDLADLQRYSEAYNNNNYQNTPHGNSAWQTIRSTVTQAYQDDKTQGQAVSDATKAVQEQTTISYVNLIELWNTIIESLAAEIQLSEEKLGSSDDEVFLRDDGLSNASPSGWSELSETPYIFEGDGNLLKDLPGSVAEMESVEVSEMHLLGLGHYDGDKHAIAPGHGAFHWPGGQSYTPSIDAKHPVQENITICNVSTFDRTAECIQQAHEDIIGSVTDYVGELYSAFGDGVVEPSDVMSPQDVIDEYADSSEQSRLTSEMLAVGAPVPSDVGFNAKFSHPDVPSAPVWGKIFPEFSGDTQDISAGTTIASADYNRAYVGYWDGSDEWQEKILPGDSDLEVHQVSGVDGEQTFDAAESKAGTNGDVVIASGDDAPEPIKSPADHSGWKVTVSGENSETTHPVSDITQDGDDYVLTTGLADGEAVKEVSVTPPVSYTKPHEKVADPTNIDRQKLKEEVEAQNELLKSLEENETQAGGGIAIPGLGSVTMPAAIAGGGVLAYFLLGDN